MKKTLLFLAVMFICITNAFSQASFLTGTIEVAVNEYGRIRLFTPDETRHLQRASILVGTANGVFDYTNDAEQLEPTVLVGSPQMSDFEIYGAYDNSYSSLPPDVIVKLNAYGWTNGAFTVVKFTVQNDETTPMTPLIGLDIIPELNQEYGFDTVSFNNAEKVIRFHRGSQVNMGIKLLSDPLTSLYSFEWYDGYTEDSGYWNWMNFGLLQPQYVSNTADGPVTITSQGEQAINPGASVEVFYAFALGANETEMLANIAAAELKYEAWFNAVGDLTHPGNEPALGQNYPNPFNLSTEITYQLPENGFVSLKVYDAIGNEVAELVNAEQVKGGYSVQFDAAGLSSGIYFYSLNFNGRILSQKMFLDK
ncbi:MAG: T9SS type A sorting domain-containing protein [Bacteroidales bacterium]|jgi:hypothetical protein|nr:T9SS type A sorting domain-containing protein [Bacteroidales bacterium]